MRDTKQPVARARGEASKESGPWLVVGLVILAILVFFGVALAHPICRSGARSGRLGPGPRITDHYWLWFFGAALLLAAVYAPLLSSLADMGVPLEGLRRW